MENKDETAKALELWCRTLVARVDLHLDILLNRNSRGSVELAAAVKYSVLNGGKRLRPLLCYAAAEAVGADRRDADSAACAVELIHAYSLVHDDLPSMDNDILRRGQPTVHVMFNEAIALLAGDALQALAFEVLADSELAPPRIASQIRTVAKAIGLNGLVGGQAMDYRTSLDGTTIDQLMVVHTLKTGDLVRAAVVSGGICNAFEQSAECLQLRGLR